MADLITGTLVTGPLEFRDSQDQVCFSIGAVAPDCLFEMLRNDVATGSQVTVRPRTGASVTFASVSAPGIAGVTPLTQADGQVPAGFEVLGAGDVDVFFDVTTTAQFSGMVTTCFDYPDIDQDGFIDGTSPPLPEDEIAVLHEESGVFVDRTSSLDTTANVVCAGTTSLSQLVVGAGAPPAATPSPTPVVTPTPQPPPTPAVTPSSDPAPPPVLCLGIPIDGCLPATSAVVTLKDTSPDRRDKLVVQWRGETAIADFGDPLTDSDFGVCLYDKRGILVVAAAAPAGELCPFGGNAKPCWRAKPRDKGFVYRDNALTPDGLQAATLTVSRPGKGNGLVRLTGRKEMLPFFGPQSPDEYFVDGAETVTLQIHRVNPLHERQCWTAALGDERKNNATDYVVRCGGTNRPPCAP